MPKNQGGPANLDLVYFSTMYVVFKVFHALRIPQNQAPGACQVSFFSGEDGE